MSDVRDGLQETGIAVGDTVIVHCSLSALGWVVGGAHTVLQALLGAVGDDGTIVMPAQTGMSDPATWRHPPVPEPWWPVIRAHWPAFDPHLTPLRAMGAVVECFHRHPAASHCGHPANGFIASGRHAATVTTPHPLEASFGDPSPLGRLYELDARIVLIGVGHGNNTSLHLAEHRAAWPGKSSTTSGAAVMLDGQRQWVTYTDDDHNADDFVALGDAYVAAGGSEGRAPVGAGHVASYPMRDLVDFGVSWLERSRSQHPHNPS